MEENVPISTKTDKDVECPVVQIDETMDDEMVISHDNDSLKHEPSGGTHNKYQHVCNH